MLTVLESPWNLITSWPEIINFDCPWIILVFLVFTWDTMATQNLNQFLTQSVTIPIFFLNRSPWTHCLLHRNGFALVANLFRIIKTNDSRHFQVKITIFKSKLKASPKLSKGGMSAINNFDNIILTSEKHKILTFSRFGLLNISR